MVPACFWFFVSSSVGVLVPSPTYNTEAYTTMLSRISVNLTEAQLKTSKERRESISKGLRKYLRETNERLNEGANVWVGEAPVIIAQENN